MIDRIFQFITLLALAWIIYFIHTEIKQISSDNALINKVLMEHSRHAANCAISALDQVENYMTEKEGNLSAIEKMKREKLRKRMAEMRYQIGEP